MRYAMGLPDRLGGLAGELAALAPAVIVCVGGQEIRSVQAATRTIPIVFMQVGDPVEQGFVASLGRPGGNTTGFSQMADDLDPKRLQLLHEIIPSLSRVAFLVNPTLSPAIDKRFPKTEAAAKSLGIALRRFDAATPAELTTALAAIETSSCEALLVRSDPLFGYRTSADCRFCHHAPASDSLPGQGVCRERRPVQLRTRPHRKRAARGRLCRQDPKGRQPRRSPGSAADTVPAGRQPQDREGDRSHDPAHRSSTAPTRSSNEAILSPVAVRATPPDR